MKLAGSPFRFPVEAGHILQFARAIGDPNPVYTDADHARAEFIRVQCELARAADPERREELTARQGHLLVVRAGAWAADWPVRLLFPVYVRGFVDPAALAAQRRPFLSKARPCGLLTPPVTITIT